MGAYDASKGGLGNVSFNYMIEMKPYMFNLLFQGNYRAQSDFCLSEQLNF